MSTGSSAAYTGTSPQRASNSLPLPSMSFRSVSTDTGTQPASSARSMTRGLSAIKTAFKGSARLSNWFSVRRAYMSSAGSLKSVMSIMFGMSRLLFI